MCLRKKTSAEDFRGRHPYDESKTWRIVRKSGTGLPNAAPREDRTIGWISIGRAARPSLKGNTTLGPGGMSISVITMRFGVPDIIGPFASTAHERVIL
jgi:hypothetical protein